MNSQETIQGFLIPMVLKKAMTYSPIEDVEKFTLSIV